MDVRQIKYDTELNNIRVRQNEYDTSIDTNIRRTSIFAGQYYNLILMFDDNGRGILVFDEYWRRY